MALIATKGLSYCTGHDGCPPSVAVEGTDALVINGRPAVLVGHHYEVHGCSDHGGHSPVQIAGSALVTVNGIPVARVGDAIECPGPNAVANGDAAVDIAS